MGGYPPTITQAWSFQKIPKVELHRHAEGSLSMGTILDAAWEDDIALPAQRTLAFAIRVQAGEAVEDAAA